ncbi:tail protein X [Comamonas sp.]|jgi:phage tail protein X|uniref:tail protein X n=1 Tax=Comamonas sp. TaxID=34028 RepID=UPI0035D9A2C2
MPITVRAQQGDTVDLLCQRHLGTTAEVTEATYALNPGLAALGPVLPMGQQVTLPDPKTAPAATKAISLWD